MEIIRLMAECCESDKFCERLVSIQALTVMQEVYSDCMQLISKDLLVLEQLSQILIRLVQFYNPSTKLDVPKLIKLVLKNLEKNNNSYSRVAPVLNLAALLLNIIIGQDRVKYIRLLLTLHSSTLSALCSILFIQENSVSSEFGICLLQLLICLTEIHEEQFLNVNNMQLCQLLDHSSPLVQLLTCQLCIQYSTKFPKAIQYDLSLLSAIRQLLLQAESIRRVAMKLLLLIHEQSDQSVKRYITSECWNKFILEYLLREAAHLNHIDNSLVQYLNLLLDSQWIYKLKSNIICFIERLLDPHERLNISYTIMNYLKRVKTETTLLEDRLDLLEQIEEEPHLSQASTQDYVTNQYHSIPCNGWNCLIICKLLE
jgi:hypothetical protein